MQTVPLWVLISLPLTPHLKINYSFQLNLIFFFRLYLYNLVRILEKLDRNPKR